MRFLLLQVFFFPKLDLRVVDKTAHRERTEVKSWTNLSDFVDLNSDRKCFICGAGPSIGFLDIASIHNHVVISVNSSILLMPWENEGDDLSRFWISNDLLCTKWTYFNQFVLKSYCTKLVRTSWKEQYKRLAPYGFRYFSARKNDNNVNRDTYALCGVSSIPTAIDFAMLMGCRKIFLLGVDQKMMHGRSHFWQFWKKQKWPRRSDKNRDFKPVQTAQMEIFDRNTSVFESLASFAKTEGYDIKNCNPNSALDVFEKITLADALTNG